MLPSPISKHHNLKRIETFLKGKVNFNSVQWTGCPICLSYFETTKKYLFKEKDREMFKGSTQNYRQFYKKLLIILKKYTPLGSLFTLESILIIRN
jgi:hypothetical protein